jgi:hypothetical protein
VRQLPHPHDRGSRDRPQAYRRARVEIADAGDCPRPGDRPGRLLPVARRHGPDHPRPQSLSRARHRGPRGPRGHGHRAGLGALGGHAAAHGGTMGSSDLSTTGSGPPEVGRCARLAGLVHLAAPP